MKIPDWHRLFKFFNHCYNYLYCIKSCLCLSFDWDKVFRLRKSILFELQKQKNMNRKKWWSKMYKMSYFSCINPQQRKFTTDRIRADDSAEKSARQSGPTCHQGHQKSRGTSMKFIQTLLLYCSCSLSISPPLCKMHM